MNVDIRSYLKESNILTLIAKFQFLNNDETVKSEFTARVIGGSLTIQNKNGVRRSCTISVENTNREFIPNPQTFWIHQKFKLYLGYDVYGTEYFYPQGVFILRNPSVSDMPTNTSVSISGIDKFSLLDGQLGGRLDATYVIPVATSIKEAMYSALASAGDPIMPILDIGTDISPYTLYTSVGQTYANILLSMNGMLSYNLYYDVNGVLRCEPDTKDSEKGSLWDFNDTEFHYQGGTQNYLFDRAYNAVKVIGDNVNGNIAIGYAVNTNPESYFNTDYTNGVVVLAPIINDSVIPDDTYAQARAEYELKRYMAMQSEISFSCTPLFLLEVDEIITLTSSNLDLENERFLINSVTIPLQASGGVMNISAVKPSDLEFVA